MSAARKYPVEKRQFTFDFTDELVSGDTIASVRVDRLTYVTLVGESSLVLTVPGTDFTFDSTGLTWDDDQTTFNSAAINASGSAVLVDAAGGSAGGIYSLSCVVTSANGLTLAVLGKLILREDHPLKFQKTVEETARFEFDFSLQPEIMDGETISSVVSLSTAVLSGEDSVILSNGVISGSKLQFDSAGGIDRGEYVLTCLVQTSGGRQMAGVAKLEVNDELD